MHFSWEHFGLLSALVVWGGLVVFWVTSQSGVRVSRAVDRIRRMPVRAVLAGLALGALVSYAGTKPPEPTTYTVEFELPLAFEPIESLTCEPGKVYNLPAVDGCRWKSSANDRLYDGGLLVFDLAESGETVTMTAIWE